MSLIPTLLLLSSFSQAEDAATLQQAATSAAPQSQVTFSISIDGEPAGDLVIGLYDEQAPQTVENFLNYARAGFYDGTIFHRVVPGFVIQGGGHEANMVMKETREPIENEADNGLKNVRGSLSMARMARPHSATSQFFVNLTENRSLDHRSKAFSRAWGYAVFGEVVSGMALVDQIAEMETEGEQPLVPVLIEQTTVTAPE